VSHAEQPPLDIHFFQSPEHEPAELHIVFAISENGFRLSAALLSQGNALFREQIIFSLLAITPEFETDLDTAIAFGLGAFGFEWAGGAVKAFIETTFGEVAVSGFVRYRFYINHTLLRRADEFILFGVIGKIVGLETQFLHSFWLAGWMLFLVEGVVLEEVAHAFFLQKGCVKNIV
jgi:hypothetical protein